MAQVMYLSYRYKNLSWDPPNLCKKSSGIPALGGRARGTRELTASSTSETLPQKIRQRETRGTVTSTCTCAHTLTHTCTLMHIHVNTHIKHKSFSAGEPEQDKQNYSPSSSGNQGSITFPFSFASTFSMSKPGNNTMKFIFLQLHKFVNFSFRSKNYEA